jgi:hypothetical protein
MMLITNSETVAQLVTKFHRLRERESYLPRSQEPAYPDTSSHTASSANSRSFAAKPCFCSERFVSLVITATVNQAAFKCLYLLHLCVKCEFTDIGTEFITGSCHAFSQFKVPENTIISRLESAAFHTLR